MASPQSPRSIQTLTGLLLSPQELLDVSLRPLPQLLTVPSLAALLRPLVLRVSIPAMPSPSCARHPRPASAISRKP
jgi:hypothetical protein